MGADQRTVVGLTKLFIIFLSKVKHINSVSWGVYKVEFLVS